MRSKKKVSIASKALLAGLLLGSFLACAAGMPLSPGAWVEDNDRIAIEDGGPYKGSWQTRDLTIDYEYQKASKNLKVSGAVQLAGYISNGFSTLDYLRLNIHSVASDGTVLETKSIRIFGYRRYLDYLEKMAFDSQLDLPEDAAAFAFSYSGKVSQGGGSAINDDSSGRIDWDFWKVPHRRPPK